MRRIALSLAGAIVLGAAGFPGAPGAFGSSGSTTFLSAPSIATAFVPAATFDTVIIRVTTDGVTIQQSLPPIDGIVEAHAIRLDDQRLQIEEARESGSSPIDVDLDPLPGAYHLLVDSERSLHLRYRITGELARLPLFVPSPEAQLAVGPVVLRVELPEEASSALDLGTSLPRFSRGADGTLTARLSSPPAFVRLDRAGGLSFARGADLVVVLLILAAAVWAWRAGRRTAVDSALARRAARRSSGRDSAGPDGLGPTRDDVERG